MFTRPVDVDDADLSTVLAREWDINAETLDYIAVGFGSHHWRATTPPNDWFVTVDDLLAKRREANETLQATTDRLVGALTTASALHEAGFAFVVAPLRTNSGQVACALGDRYVVAVYPFVSGRTYDYGSYSDAAHRDAVIGNIAALHRAPISCRRAATTETFAIARRAELFACYSHLDGAWDCGPFADPARRLLAQHADALSRVFDKYDTMATEVSRRADHFVLTHGEPHPANTITTEAGVLLVDWDTTMLAPPERDLWGLIGEDPSVADQYEALTGTPVSNVAVEFYRRAWDLSEIAIYISDFRRPHERTEDMSEAWRNLRHFLDPTRW